MLSWVWTIMVILALVCAGVTGTLTQTAAAVMTGAQAGVTLCISMAGALCLWSGVCRVMESAGLTERLAGLLQPLLHRLFPNCGAHSFSAISANVAANLLGLGNAATPLGIEAVKRMQQERVSPDELCRFVVLNTASIQLLPTTVAAIRSATGAESPFDILPSVWITSICALLAGLLAAVLLSKLWRRQGW